MLLSVYLLSPQKGEIKGQTHSFESLLLFDSQAGHDLSIYELEALTPDVNGLLRN